MVNINQEFIDKLQYYCLSLLKTGYDRHNLAEEIVQRALLKVVRVGKLNEGLPYAKRAVQHEWINYVRKNVRESVLTNLPDLDRYTFLLKKFPTT